MKAMATMTAAVLLAVHAIGAQAPETTRVQGPQGAAGPGRGGQAQPVDSRTVWAGELVIEPPTLINLGFEWFIQGDDNRNAAVAVSYRKTGETTWKPALPLLRLQGERIYSRVAARRRRAEHVRRQHPRSRAGHGVRSAVRA